VDIDYAKLEKSKQKSELMHIGVAIGIAIICYLLIQTILSTMLIPLGFYDLYQSSAVFSDCVNIIAVSFCSVAVPFGVMWLAMKKKHNIKTQLIPNTKIGFELSCVWIAFGLGWCLLSNVVVQQVINIFNHFGYQLKQYDSLEPDSALACLTCLISTAIIPAICEEFAMRCCCLGVLKKYGKAFSVFAVSIVFGLLHGNVIQFVFAFLVALVLGYVTVKTDSIFPAIFIHMFNNGLSVISSVSTYLFGSQSSTYIILVVYLIIIIASIMSLVYLISNKCFTPEEKHQKSPTELSFGSKLLCLLPGLAVPFLILIYLTSKTIVPM
jgi:membrane protease YdiL (CAAX protease family)